METNATTATAVFDFDDIDPDFGEPPLYALSYECHCCAAYLAEPRLYDSVGFDADADLIANCELAIRFSSDKLEATSSPETVRSAARLIAYATALLEAGPVARGSLVDAFRTLSDMAYELFRLG